MRSLIYARFSDCNSSFSDLPPDFSETRHRRTSLATTPSLQEKVFPFSGHYFGGGRVIDRRPRRRYDIFGRTPLVFRGRGASDVRFEKLPAIYLMTIPDGPLHEKMTGIRFFFGRTVMFFVCVNSSVRRKTGRLSRNSRRYRFSILVYVRGKFITVMNLMNHFIFYIGRGHSSRLRIKENRRFIIKF